MIYDRSYPKSGYWNFNIRYNRPIPSLSDPPRPLPPPFSSSDISLRSSTLPKSTSCAHPLSVLLESRTPLIQGHSLSPDSQSRSPFTKRTDADCSATFGSAKIYGRFREIRSARECRALKCRRTLQRLLGRVINSIVYFKAHASCRIFSNFYTLFFVNIFMAKYF